jgi:aminomethyltransferase
VRDEGVKTAWVGLKLTGDSPVHAMTPVMAQGRPIGHITYSDHGHSVGAVLATAHVETEFSEEGTAVSVLGQPATVARKAFFDPDGLRLKS